MGNNFKGRSIATGTNRAGSVEAVVALSIAGLTCIMFGLIFFTHVERPQARQLETAGTIITQRPHEALNFPADETATYRDTETDTDTARQTENNTATSQE